MASAPGWRHPRLTLLVALVAWFGLGLQLMLSLQLVNAQGRTALDGLVIYLGYFTVLTNLLVAVSLSLPLLRGLWLQTYPYPFIDVATLGYPRTLLNALGLLAVFLLVGVAFVAVARWRLRPLSR